MKNVHILIWKTYFEETLDTVGMKDIITDDFPVYLTDMNIQNIKKILTKVDGEALSYYFELYVYEYNYLKEICINFF